MLAERDGVNVQALLAKAARESLSEEMLLAERTAEADPPDAVWISSEEMDERLKKMRTRS